MTKEKIQCLILATKNKTKHAFLTSTTWLNPCTFQNT